jgi:hypothetical protein
MTAEEIEGGSMSRGKAADHAGRWHRYGKAAVGQFGLESGHQSARAFDSIFGIVVEDRGVIVEDTPGCCELAYRDCLVFTGSRPDAGMS